MAFKNYGRWLVACGALALGTSGCSTLHRNLVHDGTLRLEQVPVGRSKLLRVHVHQDGDTLIVQGKVPRSVISGHVDVTVISPDDVELARAEVPVSRPSHHRLRPPQTFRARLKVVPPRGSIIRLKRDFTHHPTETERNND